MKMTPDNQWIDDIRRRIQAALTDSKRDILRDQYGMIHEHHSPEMPPEMESKWLDYLLEFERQFENAARITVRAFIGDPAPPPIDTLNPDDLAAAVDALMDLLAAHSIAVDFLGNVDYETVYRYLTEELLDEEIDDIRIPDMWLHFTYATDGYNAESWVQEFVGAILRHDLEQAQSCIDERSWTDMSGKMTSPSELENLWSRMPVVRNFNFEVLEAEISGDNGQIFGRVSWPADAPTRAVEATFLVHRSRYLDEAWSIDRTSLIEALWREYD